MSASTLLPVMTSLEVDVTVNNNVCTVHTSFTDQEGALRSQSFDITLAIPEQEKKDMKQEDYREFLDLALKKQVCALCSQHSLTHCSVLGEGPTHPEHH
jgi:hypothetical protein